MVRHGEPPGRVLRSNRGHTRLSGACPLPGVFVGHAQRGAVEMAMASRLVTGWERAANSKFSAAAEDMAVQALFPGKPPSGQSGAFYLWTAWISIKI